MLDWVGAVRVSRSAVGDAAAEGDTVGAGVVSGVGEGVEAAWVITAVQVSTVWPVAGVEVARTAGSAAVITAVEVGPVEVVGVVVAVGQVEVAGAAGAAEALVAAKVGMWSEWQADWLCWRAVCASSW